MVIAEGFDVDSATMVDAAQTMSELRRCVKAWKQSARRLTRKCDKLKTDNDQLVNRLDELQCNRKKERGLIRA